METFKGDFSDKTKINVWEAEMAVQLVHMLLLQGYKHSDIVILTPYLGQVRVHDIYIYIIYIYMYIYNIYIYMYIYI